MTAIAEIVQAEPLIETHTHMGGATEQNWAKKTFEDLLSYAVPDLEVSSGKSWQQLQATGDLFDYWPFVRTTGYGQAVELGCRDLFGLSYTRENAPKITSALQAMRTSLHDDPIGKLYARANIVGSVCDRCWDLAPDLQVNRDRGYPAIMRFAFRCDRLLMLRNKADMQAAAKALECPVENLRQFDEALDRRVERAKKSGLLAAIKIGVAYDRNLAVGEASFADAATAFDAILSGKEAGTCKLHDYLFHRMIERARLHAVPVQIHTGYLHGTRQDFSGSNPERLMPLFAKYADVRFDLFHASWPYTEIACAIGKQFPNVWLDLCWMWAMNPVTAAMTLDSWLAAVPANKILGFGADTGSPFAMIGYALQARRGIAAVLERKIERREMDESTARFMAQRIMHANARELYPA
jgi:predicted TIM-barrel fold metal-dependent hydrolase